MEIKNVIGGKTKRLKFGAIPPKKHPIDTDTVPFAPSGVTVAEHRKGGVFKWDPVKRYPLYVSRKRKKGYIGGHDLRKELLDKPVMNANVLDYLLAHPELIPEEWKGKFIFFWGTIYCHSDGDLYVRFLHWIGFKWRWRCRCLGLSFDSGDSAALES